MKFSRVCLTVLICVFFTVGGLFAGGGQSASASAQKNSITVMMPPWGEILDTSKIDAFTKETGIAVEMTYVGWDQIHDKIVMSALSKNAPADAFEVDWSWIGEFAQVDCMEPLVVSENDKKDIPNLANFSAAGKVLALPYSNDFRIFGYNKDHLAKAGFNAPPKNWDEFTVQLKAAKDKGVVKYGFTPVLSVSESASTMFALITLARSGPVFNQDSSLNKANVLSTMRYYYQMIHTDKLWDPAGITLIDMEIGQYFMNGNYSFTIGGPSGAVEWEDDSKSIIQGQGVLALIPASSSGNRATFALPEGIGVSKYTSKKEAAIKFIQWYTNDAMQRYLYSSQGILPTRTSIMNALNKEGALLGGNVVAEQSTYINPLFPAGLPTWYPEFSLELSNQVNAVAQGSVTPEKAVDAVESKVNELRSK